MQTPAEFSHHLRMSEPFFPGCGLGLGNGKLPKEFDPCIESFVMLDAHDNKVAFAIRGKINRFVLFVAQRGNISCLIA